MKKIFKIAAYDFKRLVANPFTITTMIAVFVIMLIVGLVVKIPTTPLYEAAIAGNSVDAVYQNFVSNNTELDTQSKLDQLYEDAAAYIQTAKDEKTDLDTINNIKNTFSNLKQRITTYKIPGQYGGIDEATARKLLNSGTQNLAELVEKYKSAEKFKNQLFFTKAQFAELEVLSKFFTETAKKSNTEAFDTLADDANFGNFNILQNISPNRVSFDTAKLDEIKKIYITDVSAKLTNIQNAISTLHTTNKTSSDKNDIEKMKSYITNYKLTCESAKNGVIFELELMLANHFGDLKNLYGFDSINTENQNIKLSKIKFYLKDASVAYTIYQEPLNFNVASYAESAYDHTYFIISIIGFINIIFGIFCAYKLFGRDRRNGKMDVILSQDVTYRQTFAGKFTAIVFVTGFMMTVYTISILLGALIFYPSLSNSILAVFNTTSAYTIHPFLFLLIKVLGYELQAIFYAILTIFLMNLSRRFDLMFGISLLIFAIATICNIFLNGSLVYCFLPFIHADITSFLGGGTMATGFLKTALYAHGNFYISLVYYLVVVALSYNLTNQLFKRN